MNLRPNWQADCPRCVASKFTCDEHYRPEIECRDCDGHGTRLVPGKLDDADTCPDCAGHGWRPMTQDEIDDAAADAFSDMCEGEPPVSMQERYAAAARQKQELGR